MKAISLLLFISLPALAQSVVKMKLFYERLGTNGPEETSEVVEMTLHSGNSFKAVINKDLLKAPSEFMRFLGPPKVLNWQNPAIFQISRSFLDEEFWLEADYQRFGRQIINFHTLSFSKLRLMIENEPKLRKVLGLIHDHGRNDLFFKVLPYYQQNFLNLSKKQRLDLMFFIVVMIPDHLKELHKSKLTPFCKNLESIISTDSTNQTLKIYFDVVQYLVLGKVDPGKLKLRVESSREAQKELQEVLDTISWQPSKRSLLDYLIK